MSKFKYKMVIAYEGTHYCGWQVQPNGVSIQGLIEAALKTLYKKEYRVIGAGRTDAGVHALGQVAHFESDESLDCYFLFARLNGILPLDIRIQDIRPIQEDFHAQYSARGKIYHYHLWLERSINPFLRLYRHQPLFPLSLPLLEEGTKLFLGTHDFTSFTNAGSSVKTTVRTIHRIDMIPQEGGVRLEFEGNGFLYKMVRNIVGTLLEVASKKIPLEKIPQLLASRDRKLVGAGAPARGLFLMQVYYPLENAQNISSKLR